jgi:hypothetical protein
VPEYESKLFVPLNLVQIRDHIESHQKYFLSNEQYQQFLQQQKECADACEGSILLNPLYVQCASCEKPCKLQRDRLFYWQFFKSESGHFLQCKQNHTKPAKNSELARAFAKQQRIV